jgi:hypothetical protein
MPAHKSGQSFFKLPRRKRFFQFNGLQAPECQLAHDISGSEQPPVFQVADYAAKWVVIW